MGQSIGYSYLTRALSLEVSWYIPYAVGEAIRAMEVHGLASIRTAKGPFLMRHDTWTLPTGDGSLNNFPVPVQFLLRYSAESPESGR